MSPDLSTTYLGLELRSPLVVGAARPLSEDPDVLLALERAGAGAIVLHSLFQEEIEQQQLDLHRHLLLGSDSYGEALSYVPEAAISHGGDALYLRHLDWARQHLAIPVIASLNGTHPGRWVETARRMEAAGAAAIELNIYALPTDPLLSSAAIEAELEEIVRQVRAEVRLPLAVKLSPFFTNLSAMARRLAAAGSNLLVRDKGIKDITLITKKLKKISIDNEGIITAQAGAIDADVARFARDHERTGLEFLIGIPGTIGGGIKMNSGAFGSEFKDVLIDVKAINTEGETRAFSCKELKMEYRTIGLDKKWIFYEARFHTLRESKEKIKTRMKEIIFLRKKAQPVGVKTGGSTFKNPPNAKAWELIDEAGCRGLKIGEAMISDKHSNFIINLGKCTSNQIEDLANTVKDRVFKKSGTCLSWEIQRVGIQ